MRYFRSFCDGKGGLLGKQEGPVNCVSHGNASEAAVMTFRIKLNGIADLLMDAHCAPEPIITSYGVIGNVLKPNCTSTLQMRLDKTNTVLQSNAYLLLRLQG